MIPCKNCLILPACKNKGYMETFIDCKLIKAYVPGYAVVSTAREEGIINLYRTLKPTFWHIVIKKIPVYAYGKEFEEMVGQEDQLLINTKHKNGNWRYVNLPGYERME